jgi:HK97 family phage major capsid protein
MHPRLKALTTEFDGIKKSIDTINDRAAKRGTDLTDDEQADLDKLYDRAEQIKPEIEELKGRDDSINAVASIVSKLSSSNGDARDRAINGPRNSSKVELTAHEYFAEWFRTFHPTDGDKAIDRFVDRAGSYLDRALAQQATADNTGILPEPIVGELIKFADSNRPVFSSFTPRPMPAGGKTFTRPRITQRVNVAEQTEGQEVVSRKMTVTADQVTKRTFAGGLQLTQQDIDFTDPAILAIVLSDFTEYYAEVTEGEAADFLEELIVAGDTAVNGSTYSDYDATDVGTLVESYVDGVVAVYNKAKRVPDTIWHDLASWATLTSTTNANNDRTALSMIREALAELGSAGMEGAAGMRWVIGPQLAANTRIIGCRSLIEVYEQRKGLLTAIVPSVLATDIAYSGYVAFHGRHEGFVQLGTDPSA